MSNLVKHAETEMRLAGLYDEDADYDGLLPDAVMALVKTHCEQGHSGMSSAITLDIFNKVVNFKALTPYPQTQQNGKLWAEAFGKIRGRVAAFLKTVGQLGMTLTIQVGYSVHTRRGK